VHPPVRHVLGWPRSTADASDFEVAKSAEPLDGGDDGTPGKAGGGGEKGVRRARVAVPLVIVVDHAKENGDIAAAQAPIATRGAQQLPLGEQ
jgi:hypothetical protein